MLEINVGRHRKSPAHKTSGDVLFPVADRPFQEKCVLLVDDDEPVLTVTKRMLEREGCKVLTARNGREAVEIFRRRKDEILCVILDVCMPQMDGHETFDILCKLRKDVKVIIASGHSESDFVGLYSGKRPADFIQKPFRANRLAAKLKAVLEC